MQTELFLSMRSLLEYGGFGFMPSLVIWICLLIFILLLNASKSRSYYEKLEKADNSGVWMYCLNWILILVDAGVFTLWLHQQWRGDARTLYLCLVWLAFVLVLALLSSKLGKYAIKKDKCALEGMDFALARLININPLAPWKPEPNLQEAVLQDMSELDPVEDVVASEVVQNALELRDTAIDEICTHRSDVISINANDSPTQWRQTILNNRHTFYPVIGENEDDVIGVLDTRDYFRLNGLLSRKNILDHTMDKPFFVTENTKADDLVREMRKRKNYFAIVVDEYGGNIGIITLHDILEELLGEMSEAEDAIRPAEIVKLNKNLWRIAGSASLDDVSKALGEELQLDDFETFSGYVLGSMGMIPEDGTQMEVAIGDLNVQIKNVRNHRIRQTLVSRIEEAPTDKAKPEPDTAKA